jgi:hypothetical protein
MAKNALNRRKQVHQFKEPGQVDSYRPRRKPRGAPVCSQCGATNVKGRWLSPKQRLSLQTQPVVQRRVRRQTACPACQQLNDRIARGVVELRGQKWLKSREEVFATLLNSETIARSRNDQERILWTQSSRGVTHVYVTLPELARRLGRELEKSFQGVVEYQHSTEEPYLRVRWWSDLPHMAHRLGAPLRLKRRSRFASLESAQHKSKSFRGRGR